MSTPETPVPASANRQIARAAGTVMVAIIISQLFGLAAKILTTRAFGTGADSEAFFAANRFAEILYNLVAGGALGSAFIPTFTTLLARDERSRAWHLASAIANLVTLILIALGIIAALFAPWVVEHILAPGFTDPGQLALTAHLLRIQLISPVIFGISGLVMGILNAHHRFLFPALAPAMYWVGWGIGAALLAPWMGIDGMAWGVVIGAGLHFIIQLPALLRLPERRYQPTLGLRVPEVREVARLMAPRLLGVAVVQLNFLINTRLASAMVEGSLTGITVAFSLMLMPQAAIAQAAATAALPTFSAQAARNQLAEMRSALAATLRGVLLLAIPACVGLILLREPLVAALYQRGQFTDQSTQLVAWALLWYAAGLVGHSIVEIISRAFYALHDTRTPVMVGVGAMTFNVVFSLLFSRWFTLIGWMPHGGLALANSLATALEAVVLLALMRRRLDGLEGKRVWVSVVQAAIATSVMGLVIWGWLALLPGVSNLLLAAGGVVLGGAVYLAVVWLLRVPEVAALVSAIQRRLPWRSTHGA